MQGGTSGGNLLVILKCWSRVVPGCSAMPNFDISSRSHHKHFGKQPQRSLAKFRRQRFAKKSNENLLRRPLSALQWFTGWSRGKSRARCFFTRPGGNFSGIFFPPAVKIYFRVLMSIFSSMNVYITLKPSRAAFFPPKHFSDFSVSVIKKLLHFH